LKRQIHAHHFIKYRAAMPPQSFLALIAGDSRAAVGDKSISLAKDAIHSVLATSGIVDLLVSGARGYYFSQPNPLGVRE
jgi:hypothetical protein